MWQEEALKQWVDALRGGAVVAAPAEGVYGYCCDSGNEIALKALIDRKQRCVSKGLIVLATAPEMLAELCDLDAPNVRAAMAEYWPGAVTLILPVKADVPAILTGGLKTLAVRVPDVPYMQEYLQAAGRPVVSTSLNLSGQPPVLDAAGVPDDLPALTLDAPLHGTPSRILDVGRGVWLR